MLYHDLPKFNWLVWYVHCALFLRLMYLTTCLQEAKSFHSLTAVGGVLVAAGGQDSSERLLKSVEVFDTTWNTADWSLQEEVRDHCAVTLSDEELVILGGYTRQESIQIWNHFLKK